MESLPNNLTLHIPAGCFPLSTDSMALAHFAGNPGSRRVLDLGAGCGTLGLLLCASSEHCHVTGLELTEEAHAAALENIRRNALTERMESICTDLRRVPEQFAPGSFSWCISNPPYFSGGPAAALTEARRQDVCSMADLMKTAAWALKYGGDFYLVHRIEMLGSLIAQGAANNLEIKRLALVQHAPAAPISLVLAQLRKGGKPGMKCEQWVLHDADGRQTELYRQIYHL